MDGPERPPATPLADDGRPHRAATPAPAWPTGTVTFLFTDIEGSTRLAETLGPRWPALLERHRELIRTALAAYSGVEVQTEGDGFFAVFATTPAAVLAVVRAQRDLASEPWPADGTVRVRMGLHAGEGVLDAEGSYVGHDVHRAARVAAAAHGSQVLVSETVRALAGSTLPAGVTFRDLGEHRLKDLRPQPLWQVVVEGLPSDFPPVRSLDLRPNNLPTQLTSFVGRDHELAATADMLRRVRLLTLTGPGGTGKTRLALQLAAAVADEFPDGAWFVPLEPLRDPELVVATIARTLGVLPRPGESALDAIASAEAGRRVLLVLDNFEHVVGAAGDVGALLRACPALRVVVTSRAVLRISGEQEYVVPGLPAPPDTRRLSRVELENLPAAVRHPDPRSLDQYEAVRLFIARAVAVRPDFRVTNENAPAVAGISARLHGMPLAIELAAARVKVLAPEQILERLERQLGVLTSTARDLPERQRTLRGAIAWSCDLLDPDLRRLFARLSVFRGGWHLEAAEGVAGALAGPGAGGGATSDDLEVDVLDGLGALVDQSLVRRIDEDDGSPRFDMFETIREFAQELMESEGDADSVRAAHAAMFLRLAEDAAGNLGGADQRRWLDHLERDHDNLRAALAWTLERPEPETAVRLVFALWRFWQQRGYLAEARRDLEAIAARGWDLPPVPRARFAETLGGVAYWQADMPRAVAAYDEALGLWRERVAAGGVAAAGAPGDRRELANALYNRAFTVVANSMIDRVAASAEWPVGRAMLEEALAIYRDLGEPDGEANVLWALGGFEIYGYQLALLGIDAAAGGAGASEADHVAAAEAYFREAHELHRQAGRRTMEAWSLHMLGVTHLAGRQLDDAADASAHALRHFRDAGDVGGMTLSFDAHAAVAVGRGEVERAGRLWGAARELERASGTGLARWDEEVFATLPYSPRREIPAEVLDRLAAQGAALPLAEAVAYALGEVDPFERA